VLAPGTRTPSLTKVRSALRQVSRTDDLDGLGPFVGWDARTTSDLNGDYNTRFRQIECDALRLSQHPDLQEPDNVRVPQTKRGAWHADGASL